MRPFSSPARGALRLVLQTILALALAGAAAAHPTSSIVEETGRIDVPRGQLHYRLWTRSGRVPASPARPLLVYFHGGPGGHGTVFRHAVGALLVLRVGDVLFVDQRGCGRSATEGSSPADFTVERFADDARRVLTRVHAQHPELPRGILIGHSFGAAIAVVLARQHPALARKLVLLSPALDYRDLKYHAYLSMKQRAAREGDAGHLERIRELEARHPPGSESEAQLFTSALSGERFGFEARRFAGAEEADLHRILAGRDGETLHVAEQWRAFVAADQLDRKDLTSELPFLTMPVLVLGGAEDYLTPPGCLAKVHALAPRARLELMPRAGHHPYLLEPEEFVRRIARFAAE